jgi:hypothetical protein
MGERVVRVIAQFVVVALWSTGSGYPQPLPCPATGALPAYAHNDYENDRPLLDAVSLGFRGVEVDLFLHGGKLVAAHDRGQAGRGLGFEEVYLRPLEAAVERCGRLLPGAAPFLLNVELKERFGAAFDSLLAVLARHPRLFIAAEAQHVRPVEVVLVGSHPAAELLAGVLPEYVRIQSKVTDRIAVPEPDPAGLVRLVSLDYGKTIGWSGRGPAPAVADEWLAALRRARSGGAGRIARVYNVPSDSVVYRMVLDAGADLIGVEDLESGQRLLAGVRNEPGTSSAP